MNPILSSTFCTLICSHGTTSSPGVSDLVQPCATYRISVKCLKVKVKWITEVKYESTKSRWAYDVASFRGCQVVRGGGSMILSAETVWQQPPRQHVLNRWSHSGTYSGAKYSSWRVEFQLPVMYVSQWECLTGIATVFWRTAPESTSC